MTEIQKTTVTQIVEIKKAVKARARNCCEGSPKYPDCRAEEGQEHPATGKKTYTAVISLDPGTTDPARMRHLCGRCMIAFDFTAHRTANWREDRAAKGNAELFPIDPTTTKEHE